MNALATPRTRPARRNGYLSTERAQQLADVRHEYRGTSPIRVSPTDAGWWRVRCGSLEETMPPMCAEDWNAWIQHFVG
jgi:hypothetical protein